MTIIRRNPTSDLVPWSATSRLIPELTSMQREIDRVFDSFFRNDLNDDGSWGSFWSPDIDLIENDDAFVVKAELPGMAKEDVKISMVNNILTIRGEKKAGEEDKRKNYHRVERRYGAFQRSFTMPFSVDSNRIDAEFKDGLLTISLPKLEEAKPKTIEVKVK